MDGHRPPERWRVPVRPRALSEVLSAARALDATARLVGPVVGPGPGPGPGSFGGGRAVDGLTLDSGAVVPGDLFAALPGARHHGATWAGDAARRGAVAALSDRPCPPLPTVVVGDPRAVLGPLAAWLHDHPARDVAVHGVTGTNGKTSVAHLLGAGLAAAGRACGVGGTLGTWTPRRRRGAGRTTAEAPEIAELLAAARDDGARDVALEVSSHGLALHRVAGTRFRTAVFTNLSPDHLDLHGDLEGYFAAKASLFEPERADRAVVGVDDEWGRRLARTTACPVTTVSAHGNAADFTAHDVRAGRSGTTFRLRGPGVDRTVALRLLGAHQADNALAAVAALVLDGVDVDAAVAGVEGVAALPGRLEPVEVGQPFPAFVDFAHNTGGHRRLLPYLRSLADPVRGRVVVVVGITGERDPAKRAALGRGVARAADVVVVTDESPHDDDPSLLRGALADAAREVGGAEVVVEADRARALRIAAAVAGPGDVLAVVGRGAEAEQVVAGRRHRFDDREALRAALREVVGADDPRGDARVGTDARCGAGEPRPAGPGAAGVDLGA